MYGTPVRIERREMTRNEAIEYAKENILAYTSEMAEFKALAIEAIEKQVPKKPTNTKIATKKQMKPKWNKTSEVKPTEEKEYLCCSIYNNRPHFTVLGWSNDLYEVSEFDFYDHKGESGFYSYDSEWGYIKSDCDYWQEIEWEDEE